MSSCRPWLLESQTEDQSCRDNLGPSHRPLPPKQPGPKWWSEGKQKGECDLRGLLSPDSNSNPTTQGETPPGSLHHSEPRVSHLQNGALSHPPQAVQDART